MGNRRKPEKAQPAQEQPKAVQTVVANLVIQFDAEGRATVNHQVLADGKAVNVHLALVAVGELPFTVTSGDDQDGVMPLRALAMGVANLAASLQDNLLALLMGAIDHIGVRQQKLEAPKDETPEAPPAGQQLAA